MDDDQPNGRTRADLFGTPGSTLRLRDDAQADDASDAEARMRAALGLFGSKPGQAAERASHHESHGGGERRPTGGSVGGPGARRHRFVQDGEVPVSVVRGRTNAAARLSASDSDRAAEELAHERHLRAELERKLAEREIQLRSLQTRIGHAELERDNAVAEAREWRDKALAVPAGRTTSATEQAAVAPETHPESGVESVVTEAEASDMDDAEMQSGAAAQRGRRGPRRRPDEPQLDFVDPEPVKWWL